jgi:hypothetical protein
LYVYLPHCRIIQTTGKQHYTDVHWGRLENLHHLLVRLQRWVRRVVLGRPRALALAMALHPRLGRESGLAELGRDMLALVISLRLVLRTI